MTSSRGRSARWLGWFGRYSSAEGVLKKIFKKEDPAVGQKGPGAGVHSVDVLAIDNALRMERRYRNPLLQGQFAVTAAAAKDASLLAAARITEADAARQDRADDARRREQEQLTKDVDVSSSAVSPRFALLLEVTVPTVEIAFWVATWMREVDRREPWYGVGHVTAVLLAFAIPLLGVVCARFGGRLLHRVVKNYQGIDRADRIGAAVGAVLALTAIGATGSLVHWRFVSTSGPGAIDVPPVAMALIFSLMLLVIFAVRAFGVSELAEERHHRAVRVRRERQADTRREGGLYRSAQAHQRAWLALRGTVNECLNEVEQIYSRGGMLVLDHLAGLPEQPAFTGARTDEETHPSRRSTDGYGTPSSRPRSVLPAGFSHPWRLRFVEAAIDILDRHQPRDTSGTAQMVEELRTTLWRLTGVPGLEPRPATGDPMPHNGQVPPPTEPPTDPLTDPR